MGNFLSAPTPSVKVNGLTKLHAEFDPAGGSSYTTTFVMVMNKAKYNELVPDLKKVIGTNLAWPPQPFWAKQRGLINRPHESGILITDEIRFFIKKIAKSRQMMACAATFLMANKIS